MMGCHGWFTYQVRGRSPLAVRIRPGPPEFIYADLAQLVEQLTRNQ
jgi:hypothetical protein